MQIVPIEECSTTLHLGHNQMQQWAYTPPNCKPSGEGWINPIESYTGEWLWRRDNRYAEMEAGFDPDATQPIPVNLIEYQEFSV